MILASVWAFAKKVPYWVWLAIGGLILGWAFVEAQKAEAVRRQQLKERERELEEQARLNETVSQVGQETEDAKARALDAPSRVGDVSSADELRDKYPENARVILRTTPSSGGVGSR